VVLLASTCGLVGELVEEIHCLDGGVYLRLWYERS
jgi:hypothetical protein